MAIVQNPITGRSSGKFATAVFSKSFGKNTMRSKPMEVKNPKTLKQREQRSKFSLMVELSRIILNYVRTSFSQVAVGMSEFNMFMKSNIKTAITGVYPDYTIDFSELIVSKGTLTGADTPEAIAAAGNQVDFTWADNTGVSDASGNDYAMALLINFVKGEMVQEITASTREDMALSANVPTDWVGDSVNAYLSFSTDSRDKISDSTYLGEILILA